MADRRRDGLRGPARTVGPVAAGVLAVTFLLGSGLGGDPRAHTNPLVGRPAPGFDLPRLGGGGSIDLVSLRGQVVVVNFWASWCRACEQEHPSLLQAWSRYRERGVVLVGVDFEDSRGAALAFARRLGGDWPLVEDPGSRTAIAYGVFGVPETFVIAPDGSVVGRWSGPISYGWLIDRIERALSIGEAR